MNILIIDDDEDDFILIREMLKDGRKKEYQFEWVSTYQHASQMIKRDTWDVIFVDYDLGAHNGLDLIREAVHQGIKTPLIMVTGRGRYELDIEAMNSGAADYLPKNMINPPFLERVVRYTIERSRSKEILEQLVEQRTSELRNAMEEMHIFEEELRTQNEELLRSTLQQTDETTLHRQAAGTFPLIEILTDRAGSIIKANQETARIFHIDSDTLEGKLLSFFIYINDRRRFVQLLSQLERTSLPITDRFSILNDENDLTEWCFNVVPIKNKLTDPSRYYWLLHPLYGQAQSVR